MKRQINLTLVIDAGRLLGGGFGATKDGQQQGSQNPDYGDDHQQFDQREPAAASRSRSR
jgi:hypothetical protein